jgi:hypothetical protein
VSRCRIVVGAFSWLAAHAALGCVVAIVAIVIIEVYLGCSELGVHEELEASHADPAGDAVLVELHRADIVVQEPTHVLKHEVRGLEKVDPGEEVEDDALILNLLS